jgi:cytoskeletal protein CcmA (bactofilin family)
MSNEIKRMKYFNGLLLKEEDLALEQEYHMKLQRLHNRFFHDWGIVDGLKVEAVGDYPQVTVSQGLALNRVRNEETKEEYSQEIWICDNHPDSPVNLSDCDVDKDIYIMVFYDEIETDIDSKKGGDKNIHIWERSRIKYSYEKPTDKSKEIIIARVRLKSLTGQTAQTNQTAQTGQTDVVKVIDYVSYTETDNITPICTYAVTQGTAQEFEKIRIGLKDKLDLPSINGLSDKNLGDNDGLYVESPYTKFSGSIISSDLKTNGKADINGTLLVNLNDSPALQVDSSGDVYIGKAASVKGKLSAMGGLNVSGDNTTLDTTHVEMTGNMLTVNKYTPEGTEIEPRNVNSGVEVFRGGSQAQPNAKLVWDETAKAWKAGTDLRSDVKDSGLYNVAYGPDWDNMHNGSHVDKLHKHSNISSADGSVALSTDDDGNVTIDKKVIVSGSVVAKNGIEVPSQQKNARIIWNDEDQHWQIGVEGDLYNIPYGEDWQDLTNGNNADQKHTHSEFYNSEGTLVMTGNLDGDVRVNKNLTVGNDLTVEGRLKLLDPEVEEHIIRNQIYTDNVVIVNKLEDGNPTVPEGGGLEVYRGENIPNARIIWDEGSDKWKIGTGDNLSVIPNGIEWEYLTRGENVVDNMHKHSNLATKDGTEVLTIDSNGNVEADKDVSVGGNLTVENDGLIRGDVTVEGSLVIDGTLEVHETKLIYDQILEVEKNVVVVNKYQGQSQPLNNQGGMEVYRGGGSNQNAMIVWNEGEGKWKVGTGDSLEDLPYGEKWDILTLNKPADTLHNHGTLCDRTGNAYISLNSTTGDIDIKKAANIKGGLTVDGPVTVTGDFDITSITKIDTVEMQVQDHKFTLNIFEGDTSPVNESGIEIFRGKTEPTARMVWDENAKVWKMGVGNDLKEIAYGTKWEKLINNVNVDTLHRHGQLYNEKGTIMALSTTATGNIDVKHDLTVNQDLTVTGNLDIQGQLTKIKSSNIEIQGNSITLNRSDLGDVSQNDTSISVYRGPEAKSAVLNWNENNQVWQVGMSNSSAVLTVNNDGTIKTPAATIDGKVSAGSAYITGILTAQQGIEVNRQGSKPSIKWDEASKQWKIGVGEYTCISAADGGYVGIGTQIPKEKLDVNGNAIVNGKMDVTGNSTITGTLTAGNAEIKGSLKVDGGFALNGGIEVQRKLGENGEPLPKAQILWDDNRGTWTFGVEGSMGDLIPNGAHKHSKLYTEDGNNASVVTTDAGNVGIGTDSPRTKLEVSGDALISGKVEINSTLDVAGKAVIGGKVTAKDSFDIKAKDGKTARLFWDENNGGVWQAGTEGNLQNISLSGHSHTRLYTSSTGETPAVVVDGNGSVAIGRSAPENAKLDVAGNVKAQNLTLSGSLTAGSSLNGAEADIRGTLKAGSANIKGDLTVSGNLTVDGEFVTVNTTTLSIEDNVITLNKYGPLPEPAVKNAGIEIYRGGTASNAQIIWDESKDEWQAGTTSLMSAIEFKGHEHPELTSMTDIIKTNSGKIGIGTASPSEKLDVNGNAKVSGKLTATSLEAGDITVGGTSVGKGLEVTRTGGTKAQINWNEAGGNWQTVVDGTVKGISLYGHTHSEITDITGVLKVNSALGRIGIGTATPTEKLDVNGNANINGKLSATLLTAGDITVGGTSAGNGFEVTRTGGTKAQIVWNETTSRWEANNSTGEIKGISLMGHVHDILGGTIDAPIIQVDSNKNVGIGTKTPTEKLDVNGNVKVSGSINVGNGLEVTRANGTDKAQIVWNETLTRWEATKWDSVNNKGEIKGISLMGHVHDVIGIKNTTRAVITVGDNGNVSIGEGKAPETDVKLSVDGTIKATTIMGNVTATNVTQSSSRTLKDNIEELSVKTAVDLLKKLRPVTFDYRQDCIKKHNIGFIAEDVPDIFTSDDCKSISVMDIVAVLTSVVKKQQSEMAAVKKQLTALQKQVAELIGA